MSVAIQVYEDDDLLRENLCSMMKLNNTWQLTGAFENVLEIEKQVQDLQPDVIFMDIDMPGMTGIEAVKKLRLAGIKTHIIMLTVFDDNQHVLDAICAGSSGYLLKKNISIKLFDAVEEVLSGGAPMSPSIARMVIRSMQTKPINSYQLSDREKEILASLSTGNSYKLIANQFNISVDTVKTHLKKIYEKLHVHSQTEAVAKAIQEKLV